MFLGGVETNMTTLEWIMQELISHPDKMAKVATELKSVIGDEKVLDESKISKLLYFAGSGEGVVAAPPSSCSARSSQSRK